MFLFGTIPEGSTFRKESLTWNMGGITVLTPHSAMKQHHFIMFSELCLLPRSKAITP